MGFTIQSRDLAENAAAQSPWFDTDTTILERAMAGVGVLTGCGVTPQGSPNMTVAVAAGTVQASAGAAAVTVTSGNVTITAADATHPRIDLVTASATGVKTVTDGTAAASPKPPALPAGHIALAMIYVPATATQITTARITDKRFTVISSALGRTKLGTTTIGASFDNTMKAIYKKITVPAGGGFLPSVAVAIKGQSSGSAGLIAAIMTDNAGTPENVVAVGGMDRTGAASAGTAHVHALLGGLVLNTTARFVSLPVGVDLAAGDYWIVVMNVAATGNDVQFAYSSGTGSDRTKATTDGAYDHSVGASSTGTNDYSLYANLLT